MNFSAYWKEIAVVFAGVFAIVSAIFDLKDKRTGKITIWGRVFFALTILSMIGGFYAQWRDNTTEEKRNKKAQDDMISLLRRTERSVYDLSRLLQPIGKPRMTLFLRPDCNNAQYKRFCEAAKLEGRREAAVLHISGQFIIQHVDWSSLPHSVLVGNVFAYFFKDAAATEKFFSAGCLNCDNAGDMYLDVFVTSEKIHSQTKTVSVFYDTGTNEMFLLASQKSLTPHVHNDNILSVIDIPGSTMVLSGGNMLLNDLTLTNVTIDTSHGQTIKISTLQPRYVGARRVFVYHFPSKS